MDVDSLSIEQTDENKSTNISEGNHEDSAEIPYHLFQFLSSAQCNMQSLCRICLSTDNKIMFPLYSTKELSMFACMFTTLTGIEINPDDGLPANVCKSCRTEIMSCYKFKIQCEKATKILISVLKCFTKVEPIGNNNSPEHDPEFHNTKVKKEFNILSSEGVENSNDINLNNIKNDICMLPNIVKRENCSEYVPEIHKTKARITKKKIGNSNAEDVEYLDDVISDDSYSLCMAPDVRKRKKRKVIISVTDSNSILNEIVAEKKSYKTSRQKIYSCKYCNKKFYNMKLLRAHLNNNHKKIQESELKFSCSHCKDAFSSEHDLKLHLILHSKGPIWTCSKCEKVFESKSLLRRHIYRHMESKRYSCDSCGKLFTELYALRRHSRVHTGEILEKKHECHLCDKKYSGSGLLAAHIARHEGRRPYVCSVCGKTFPSRRLLLSHSLTHSDNKPYACSYCDKRFRHESTRNTHHRTHTGEKPYICSTCGKTFIQNSNLKLHMRVHTGEKPYSCSTCNRKFSSGSSLKMHERTHTGEKPYECKICKKTFARMNMKAHMLIHTGERPYTCTMCPKKFVNAARLRDHSRVHTGEKPFDCESCSQKFPTKSHLLRHMKTHIKDNTSTEQDCETIVFDIEEVPIEVTEELVLQDKNDVKTEMLVIDGSHDYQTQNILNANGVIVNDINYANNVVAVKEGDVGVATSEADLEGATVKLYQLDQSLLQIHSSGGQLTIRKITSKMTANF